MTLTTTTQTTAGQKYRFDRLTTSLAMADMSYPKEAPSPGDHVPAFDLPIVGGGRFSSAELDNTVATLMVFGSFTCPVTESSAGGLRDLHARFGDDVRFVMVNVREAHPGEKVPQPSTIEEKQRHADRLGTHHRFEFEVATDDIDGTLHRAMSPKPNSAYLLGPTGEILFRVHWANDTKAIEQALIAVVAGTPLKKTQSSALAGPMMKTIGHVDTVLEAAGPRSWKEMWRAALPMAMLSKLAPLFSFVDHDRRGPLAILTMMSIVAAVAVAVVLLAI